MIKGTGLVCVVLGLATVASLVSAEPLSLTELDETSYELAEALSKYFLQLNDILKAKLPDNNDPEENMKLVKGLSTSIDTTIISKKIALTLIAELYSAKDRCDYLSYKSFAKNYVANDLLARENPGAQLRTRMMLDHYARIHAKNCRASYRKDFQKKLPKVDKKSLQRVQGAFKDVSQYDFHYEGSYPASKESERRRYLSMELNNLSESPVPEATNKILSNILAMVKGSDMWQSLKPSFDESTAQQLIPKPTEYVFEEFLFKPCASYERVLGATLSWARLDAFVEEQGGGFLADDEQFYGAMMQSRLCKKVLKEEKGLKEVLIEHWLDAVKDSI